MQELGFDIGGSKQERTEEVYKIKVEFWSTRKQEGEKEAEQAPAALEKQYTAAKHIQDIWRDNARQRRSSKEKENDKGKDKRRWPFR